jgi:hypothetical protein
LYAFLFSPMRIICPTHSIPLGLIILVISDKKGKAIPVIGRGGL